MLAQVAGLFAQGWEVVMSDDGRWAGRIEASLEALGERVGDLRDEVRRDVHDVRTEVAALRTEVGDRFRGVDNTLQSVQTNCAAMSATVKRNGNGTPKNGTKAWVVPRWVVITGGVLVAASLFGWVSVSLDWTQVHQAADVVGKVR